MAHRTGGFGTVCLDTQVKQISAEPDRRYAQVPHLPNPGGFGSRRTNLRGMPGRSFSVREAQGQLPALVRDRLDALGRPQVPQHVIELRDLYRPPRVLLQVSLSPGLTRPLLARLRRQTSRTTPPAPTGTAETSTGGTRPKRSTRRLVGQRATGTASTVTGTASPASRCRAPPDRKARPPSRGTGLPARVLPILGTTKARTQGRAGETTAHGGGLPSQAVSPLPQPAPVAFPAPS